MLEKKSSTTKRDKDKKKSSKDGKESKDKGKDANKDDAKTEKSPKKKWFWTLPLRRKSKDKEEGDDDDDGGFKESSTKTARKAGPSDPANPSSESSDVASTQSSSDYSYRSSPSSEVNYYNQRAQQQQQLIQQQYAQQQQYMQLQQQHMLQQQYQQQLLQQQQHQQLQNMRSLPGSIMSTGNQGSFNSSQLSLNNLEGSQPDVTDLTKTRKFMSREEMYSAMRHPQYYNYNRHSYAGQANPNEANNNGSATGRSPQVFSANNVPPNAVKPMARSNSSSGDYVSRESQDTPIPFIFKENGFEELNFGKVRPPAGYGEDRDSDFSDSEGGNDKNGVYSNDDSKSGKTKLTTLLDFKKMVLQQSLHTAQNKERISAVELLKASRPSIYGYEPPSGPSIKMNSQQSHDAQNSSRQRHQEKGIERPTIEGIIMPPTSRNTARALLFQSRFGSGRRFRASKTDIISTTILEDHGGEITEEASIEEMMSEEETESEGEEQDSQSLLMSRVSLGQSVALTPSGSPGKSCVLHSTPIPGKAVMNHTLGDISRVERPNPAPDESMETSL